MPRATYRVKMTNGYKFRFVANLDRASAPIWTFSEDGGLVPSRYCSADVQHCPEQAAELVYELECESEGSDGAEVYYVKAFYEQEI